MTGMPDRLSASTWMLRFSRCRPPAHSPISFSTSSLKVSAKSSSASSQPVVVVTLGARGALLVLRDGSPALLQPPPEVAPVDTTGAGDCFTGALAQALAGGQDLPGAVRYAVAAAALSTTGEGARGGLPGDDEVQAVLARVPQATEVA